MVRTFFDEIFFINYHFVKWNLKWSGFLKKSFFLEVIIENLSFVQLIDHLNKYRFCLSPSRKYAVLDDIGKHFLDSAVELVRAGKTFVHVIDNTDWEEKAHDMRRSHHNKSVHAVVTSIVFDRISTFSLPGNAPQADIKTCNFREIVALTRKEINSMRSRCMAFVHQILFQKFPEFQVFKPYIRGVRSRGKGVLGPPLLYVGDMRMCGPSYFLPG